MSGGYKVIMDDLVDMSRLFEREAATLHGLTATCAAVPDGGDGTIDAALSGAVQTATTLINQLAGAVRGHGEKLASAEQQYRDAELKNSELISKLTGLIGGGA